MDYPPYLSFPKSNILGYFLQEDIYEALHDSPYDFFIFGNAHVAIILSKEALEKFKPEVKSCTHFYLDNHNQNEIVGIGAKAKKSERVKFKFTTLNSMLFVTEDMCFSHIWHLQLSFLDKDEKPIKASLYCDDLLAEVTSLSEANGTFNFTFLCEGIEGNVSTNFKNNVNFSFINILFSAGEVISLHVSQHDAQKKQKIMTGIKRLVIDRGNQIDIYITPPHSQIPPENIRISPTCDLPNNQDCQMKLP